MKLRLPVAACLLLLFRSLPAQVFDPNLAASLQNTIDSMRIANNLQGISASVIYPGEGMWQGVTGESYAGNPITPDMEFGIASNTKLFTAVIVLKLGQSHLIDLDDSLYSYLPSFPNVDSTITIRQLLNHTSGLADINNVVGYADSILTNPNRVYTSTDLMSWIGSPLFAPGTNWNYSNTNYILAAMVAETASGQSYGQLLHDSILDPLGLDSTFLGAYDSVLNTIAHPWQSGIDKYAVPRTALNSAAWSAGGMYSTSAEMARWYEALMNGQVLGDSAFLEMTNFVGSGNYGCGLFEMTMNGRTVWEHGGTIWGGYNSQMIYDTSSGAVICVLINANPAQAFPVGKQLHAALLNTIAGLSPADNPENTITAYPNPVQDQVHLRLNSYGPASVCVYDAYGKQMNPEIIADPADGSVRFDMAGWSAGIYFITVADDGKTCSIRVCKE